MHMFGETSLLCRSADVSKTANSGTIPLAEEPNVAERNILIAVDDSDTSERACQWAIDNLYREGDVLHLFHVIPIPMPQVVGGGLTGEFTYITPDPHEDVSHIEDAKAMINARFVSKAVDAEVPYQIELVRYGTGTDAIGEAICKRAEIINAVTVVIASHNKGLMKEIFLGSVTNYVNHHCKQPVLVMH